MESATRETASIQIRTTEGEEGMTVEHATANDAPPPAKKSRRNTAAASKKQHRAKPGKVCHLNLDVLFLIAAYIHPMDLLNLARTCKSLRQLLMNRSSTFVWKETRKQIEGLPTCPDDLTEPEYANLVFFDRCHGCGKKTDTIFWNVRRRYCPKCKRTRLRLLSSCNEVICDNHVLPREYVDVKKSVAGRQLRVDRRQAATFMDEYRQSSNKIDFIDYKRKQCGAITRHATQCQAWEVADKEACLQDRESEFVPFPWPSDLDWRWDRIFRRLRQLGYSPEIEHFSLLSIRRSRESDFGISKRLTDKEWQKIRPGWVKTMNRFRSQLFETKIYGPRRLSLRIEYENFLRSPSSNAPAFDLLPSMADVAHFPPFRDVLEAPEETKVNRESFASAFAQLPVLVAEWKKKLDAELTDMVHIPSKYSRRSASGRKTQSSGIAPDRLQLACALFLSKRDGPFTHLEMFSLFKFECGYLEYHDDRSEQPLSDRYVIQFLEEAPYIVYACGLDPNVATIDDMDHRNARLLCLSCKGEFLVGNWRHAMWHASVYHRRAGIAPLSKSPRWQLVNDEHVDAIQATEQSIERDRSSDCVRCLLCRPHVGDAIRGMGRLVHHLTNDHGIKTVGNGNVDATQGVYYAPIGICDPHSVGVEMVSEKNQVSFRPAITFSERMAVLAMVAGV